MSPVGNEPTTVIMVVKLRMLYTFCGQHVLYTFHILHYCDVMMSPIASHITSITVVYSTVYSGAEQRKHQSSESLAFMREIHRCPVNSPHTKGQ